MAHRDRRRLRDDPARRRGRAARSTRSQAFEPRRVKVVAVGLVSNALGTVNDVPRLAAWAHERGAICVVDAAQAAPHRALDVQALGADFVAVSGSQDVRAERHRLPLGAHRAAARDGAVPLRRSHDPPRRRPGDDLGRAAGASSRRGRRRWPRRSGSARRSTTWRRSGSTRSKLTSTRSSPTRSSGSPSCPGVVVYGPPAERRAGIVSFNVWTDRAARFIRTTLRRCSTSRRRSRFAPATTAASR